MNTPRTQAGRLLLGKNAGRDPVVVEWLANDIWAIEEQAGHLIDLDVLMASAETIGLRMQRDWWVEVLTEYARRRKASRP